MRGRPSCNSFRARLVAFRREHTGDGPVVGTLVFSAGGPGGIVNANDLIDLQTAIGAELAAAFDLVAWTQRAAFASGHMGSRTLAPRRARLAHTAVHEAGLTLLEQVLWTGWLLDGSTPSGCD